jgi:5'-3' exonuclease
VDGDSLLHRAYHAMLPGGDRDAAGHPTWALRGLLTFIASAAARLEPSALVVGFDCRARSVRMRQCPSYKAQRPEPGQDLAEQLAAAPLLLREAGVAVAVSTGFEADDVLASAAALGRRQGWLTTLVTSDRDAFALLDATTSVLRVVRGGIDASPVLTPEELTRAFKITPAQYGDYAALRGDASDNLPGVAGIGPALAARLLGAFGTLDGAYAALDGGRRREVLAAVGAAATAALASPEGRAVVERNRRLMAMHADLDLPSPAAMALPLDATRVRSALRAREIRLGPSLRALLGADPRSRGGRGASAGRARAAGGTLRTLVRRAAGADALPAGQLPLF